MRRRRLLAGMLAAAALPLPFTATAAARDFDADTFRAAQEAGRSIVVQVHATW